MKDNNYINIQGWQITKLKLKGNELIIFAIIYGFSQDGNSKYRGSLSYIQNALQISRNTVIKSLNKLIEKNLILKEINNTGNLYSANIELVHKVNRGSAKSELVASAESEHNNNNTNNKNINNIAVLNHWNSKGIVSHKETKVILNDIDKAIKNYDLEEIKQSIDNYAEIYNSEKTYFKYKWTLSEFLNRKNALPVFIHKSVEDYLIGGIPKTQAYKNKNSDSMVDRLKAKNNLS